MAAAPALFEVAKMVLDTSGRERLNGTKRKDRLNMGFVSAAINAGIEDGLPSGGESGFANMCDGYEEPSERCPLTAAQGGCICLRVRARRNRDAAPRWRRLFMAMPEPPMPLSALIALLVEYIATDGMMTIPKRNDRRNS